MKSNWKREFYRDSITLGSPLFYGLALVRTLIGNTELWILRFGLGIVVLELMRQVAGGTPLRFSGHASRAVLLSSLIVVFYNELLPTVLFLIVALVSAYALVPLKRASAREAILGVLIGAALAAAIIAGTA